MFTPSHARPVIKEVAMSKPVEIRLGSILVRSLDGRRFHLQDFHNAELALTLEDADVSDLIVWLQENSRRAAKELKVYRVSGKLRKRSD
jgi:hypothetical protein